MCPDTLKKEWPNEPEAVWDDVTVLLPNVLHEYSSDEEILSKQFESMSLWLNEGLPRGEDGLWAWNAEGVQLGDWLDPTAPPDEPGAGKTDDLLVADAYLVHTTKTFSEVCQALQRHELSAKHSAQAEDLKTKFQDKYITPIGNVMSNSQTALSLVVVFSLYQNVQGLRTITRQLVKLVRRAKFRISTGFAGTPLICHALCLLGEYQLAYRMLLEKRCPSWLYPITMGATTAWERWNSVLPDGSINPGQMTSFNHYALGAVADWLHTNVGGIMPLQAGWKQFLVRPVTGGNLTSASVSFQGPFGLMKCAWRLEDSESKFVLEIVVPPNTSAQVILPSRHKPLGPEVEKEEAIIVSSGRHHFVDEVKLAEWPPKPIFSRGGNPDEGE